MKEMYKDEIKELTELLREDENWDDLREILIENNIKINEIILVSFMEDEEENEYGVFINKKKQVIEYERTTFDNKQKNYFKIKDITNNSIEKNKYPQIMIAIEMIESGEI